ncbi:myotrophin isoform X1 [Neodiprion pinetum]|uniref:Myotrophin isoform X1 n=1 Tax=Neodiprion lecontei TaxID=441921 RepID=A0A6J0BAR3_NEOLC|nr:myotrophin isoform X1 [Neodiprion lecontei]XP_046423308.1 myotrophin isoform X1 [Neodiprion fabricii]XP_046479362.1 myotrophin isoform X1 [Neodiprion pinetum]XP_046617571.1 myotrophin isoform X1 [Neodiprion virginianus]
MLETGATPTSCIIHMCIGQVGGISESYSRITTPNMDIDVNQMIDGRTPLHYAADYGQGDVLRYLLEKGADANATDKHGITTLLAAIWEGHTNCVKLLLERGANPDGSTPDGTSYLEAAEKDEIKQLLKSH